MDTDSEDEGSIASEVELSDTEEDQEYVKTVKKSKKDTLTSKMIDKWAEDLRVSLKKK
jgi:hypothetical protein